MGINVFLGMNNYFFMWIDIVICIEDIYFIIKCYVVRGLGEVI